MGSEMGQLLKEIRNGVESLTNVSSPQTVPQNVVQRGHRPRPSWDSA